MSRISISAADGAKISLPDSDFERLRSGLRGELILPSHERYDAARRVWNGLIDRRPGVIVRCGDVSDVADSVGFARENGLRLSVRGGGHNVSGRAVNDGGMVIDLSPMRSIRLDPGSGTVRVEGGATLGDLDRATQAFGLSVPVGLVSATGIGGLTLHGGMGWLTRKRGLTVDSLVSAEVVAADGSRLRATERENEDLLWSLKGGGGGFGVVTSFEFRTHRIGPSVWLAAPVYPLEEAPKVLRFVRDFMAGAPEDLGALAIYWTVPALHEIPEEFHGRDAFLVLACYSGPAETGERIVKPLREVSRPIADLSMEIPYLDLQRFIDSDYPDGRLYYWKSLYLSGLGDDVIADLGRIAEGRPSPLTSLDIWFLGGAVSRVGETDTPFANRSTPFLLAVESNWDDPAQTDLNVGWTRRAHEEMRRHSTGGSYLNFPGFAEEGEELLRGAYGTNYGRLKRAKAKYDPGNLFGGLVGIRV